MLHIGRIKWALRKVRLPVGKNALVLDVGSGNSPYPRSDVLLDRLKGDAHRCGQALIVDRTLVLGDAFQMPFKDKAFDFVVASHILEHMKEPEIFLAELMRIAKAGYIETPNAIGEQIVPMNIHCLEVMNLDNKLVIRKKSSPADIGTLGILEIHKKNSQWQKLFRESPDLFHTRYFWKDHIDYEILNPETSCDWIDKVYEQSTNGGESNDYRSKGWRGKGIRLLARYYRLLRNLRKLNIDELLACPECKTGLVKIHQQYKCNRCSRTYLSNPYPDFN